MALSHQHPDGLDKLGLNTGLRPVLNVLWQGQYVHEVAQVVDQDEERQLLHCAAAIAKWTIPT